MTPTEKAELLKAVAEMTKVNAENASIGVGSFKSITTNCFDAANLILESIKNDFKEENP